MHISIRGRLNQSAVLSSKIISNILFKESHMTSGTLDDVILSKTKAKTQKLGGPCCVK